MDEPASWTMQRIKALEKEIRENRVKFSVIAEALEKPQQPRSRKKCELENSRLMIELVESTQLRAEGAAMRLKIMRENEELKNRVDVKRKENRELKKTIGRLKKKNKEKEKS